MIIAKGNLKIPTLMFCYVTVRSNGGIAHFFSPFRQIIFPADVQSRDVRVIASCCFQLLAIKYIGTLRCEEHTSFHVMSP